MYGYVKTLRLCLAEYLLALALHTIYAFLAVDIETGRVVMLVSIIMISVTFIFASLVHNEKIVVIFIFISVVISTTIIGYMLDTLSYSVLVYIVLSAVISIFMESRYILYSMIIGVVAFICYLIFIPEVILKNLHSLFIFCIYIVLYLASMLNLFVVVYNAKKNMKGMEEKAKEAERANASKMLFLANMSHEIRTPMNAICGMAELTLRDESLSSEARENTESIQTAGRVLISIVNDILDYSKMESGSMDIIPVAYSFRRLVDDVFNMMTVRLEDKNIELRKKISDNLPDTLIGDEIRIRQILFNLLSNAIKFTDKGYVELEVTGVEDTGFLDLTITVTDTGIGIKKEDIPNLFTSFQQVDTRKLRNKEGTGLGLAICKKLLSLMGGDINVESTYGVGTKFVVHLCQKISDEVLITNKETSSEDEASLEIHDARVLVVDDNAVNLKVASGLLKNFGISVDTCKSGRECLDILSKDKGYDVIFLDHMMPELDGIDTLKLIRATDDEYMKKVPLIVLTANVISGIREMFIAEGFDDFIPKPIDVNWMQSVLRKYIPVEKQR